MTGTRVDWPTWPTQAEEQRYQRANRERQTHAARAAEHQRTGGASHVSEGRSTGTDRLDALERRVAELVARVDRLERR